MKKINNNGLLSISINSNNEMSVIFRPVNDTVWMDRNELCGLFGCTMMVVDQCIGDIFGKNMLRVEDTCQYHVVAGGKRISYDITAVNLAVIITMAFQLGTSEARTLRMWFIEQFTKIKYLDIKLPDIGEKFQMN